MSRYIDADAIKDKAWKAESEACFYALEDVVSVTDIDEAPSIDIDLADDGTLSVEVDDATKVTRVLVEDGKNGDLYYADRPQEWIPCSERLPSECDEFLVTWTASVTNGPLLAFAEYEPDALLVSGGKWHLEDDMREFKDVDVIAWMPLPKPWKGEDDERVG